MLETRARSVFELRRALIKKGEPAAEVDAAVERLRNAGLLDDAAYARQLARSKAMGPGQSRRRIAQELARRGVARDLGDKAIAEVFEDEGQQNVYEAALMQYVQRFAEQPQYWQQLSSRSGGINLAALGGSFD